MNQTYHEMILEKVRTSKVEEWYCPVCRRRILVQWLPVYRMIILAAGDKDIQHSISKSNLPMGSRPVT